MSESGFGTCDGQLDQGRVVNLEVVLGWVAVDEVLCSVGCLVQSAAISPGNPPPIIQRGCDHCPDPPAMEVDQGFDAAPALQPLDCIVVELPENNRFPIIVIKSDTAASHSKSDWAGQWLRVEPHGECRLDVGQQGSALFIGHHGAVCQTDVVTSTRLASSGCVPYSADLQLDIGLAAAEVLRRLFRCQLDTTDTIWVHVVSAVQHHGTA